MRRSFFLFLIIFCVCCRSYGEGQIKFIDLTGKLYKGSDENLKGLSIKNFGFGCSGGFSNLNETGPMYISWDGSDVIRQTTTRKGNSLHFSRSILKSYRINFRFKDRTGKIVREVPFNYLRNYSDIRDGGIIQDAMKCDRPMARIDQPVHIPYGTVEWWLSEIKWEEDRPPAYKDDRQAFSVEDQLKGIRKEEDRNDSNKQH